MSTSVKEVQGLDPNKTGSFNVGKNYDRDFTASEILDVKMPEWTEGMKSLDDKIAQLEKMSKTYGPSAASEIKYTINKMKKQKSKLEEIMDKYRSDSKDTDITLGGNYATGWQQG